MASMEYDIRFVAGWLGAVGVTFAVILAVVFTTAIIWLMVVPDDKDPDPDPHEHHLEGREDAPGSGPGVPRP